MAPQKPNLINTLIRLVAFLWLEFRARLPMFLPNLWHALLRKDMEILLAACSTSWGAWLVSPPYDTFSRSITYAAMAELGPEQIWGGLMLMIGTLKILGIGFSVRNLRRIGLFIAMLLWIFQGAMFYSANSSTPGTAIYIIFGIANSICFALEWRRRR